MYEVCGDGGGNDVVMLTMEQRMTTAHPRAHAPTQQGTLAKARGETDGVQGHAFDARTSKQCNIAVRVGIGFGSDMLPRRARYPSLNTTP